MNALPTDAPALDIGALRQLALAQPEEPATRILAILICAALLISVLTLVHRGRLREEYTPIWVVVSLGMMIVIGSFDVLRSLTRFVGAWTPSSTLFFFGLVFLLVLSLNYAVRLSGMSLQLKLLAQEVALLRQRLREVDGDISPPSANDD
jgi:small-conductance mechanosensitive channel